MTSSSYATTSWRDAPPIAREHGFCLVQDFFDPAEVARWEAMACAVPEAERQKDFLTLSPFDALLLDPRVLDLARALIGPEIVYYGETAFSLGAPPFRAWHYDARGLPEDIDAPHETDGKEVYPGWRFGIYFRDYRAASGSLKVSPGSHLKPAAALMNAKRTSVKYTLAAGSMKIPTPPFPIYNVPSAPGDLVIFNLHTFHSAGALLLKENHQAQLMPDIETKLLATHPILFESEPALPRNALFLDYGAPSPDLDLYIKWRAHHIHRDPKMHSREWEEAIRGSDLGVYAYDQAAPRKRAEECGVTLRYDRIIAQLLYKRTLMGSLTPSDQARLDLLIKINREFSPYHSLTNTA